VNKREMKKELKKQLGWYLWNSEIVPLDELIELQIPTLTESSQRRLEEVKNDLVAELIGFEKYDSVGARREMRKLLRRMGIK